MKKFLIGTIFLGLASLGYSQSSDFNKNEKISSIEVIPMDQVYLDKVSDETFSERVYTLERKASRYNIKEHPSYNAKYSGAYRVFFLRGNSKIVATYDRHGKITRTKESFNNLLTPIAVRESVYDRYPNWTMKSTAYTVNYDGKEANKIYKVQIVKDGVKKKLNLDLEGNIRE
jgi:hypothetical protein